jgi:hypothetical protein
MKTNTILLTCATILTLSILYNITNDKQTANKSGGCGCGK